MSQLQNMQRMRTASDGNCNCVFFCRQTLCWCRHKDICCSDGCGCPAECQNPFNKNDPLGKPPIPTKPTKWTPNLSKSFLANALRTSHLSEIRDTNSVAIDRTQTGLLGSEAENMPLTTHHFRDLVSCETLKLNQLSYKWIDIMDKDSNIPEEGFDQIRTTIGQSNLFINHRLKQFVGLIEDCELKRGLKETKVEDLQGFWDMIYYQIIELHNKFDALTTLKSNNWVEVEVNPKPIKPMKKRIESNAKPRYQTNPNQFVNLTSIRDTNSVAIDRTQIELLGSEAENNSRSDSVPVISYLPITSEAEVMVRRTASEKRSKVKTRRKVKKNASNRT